MKKLLFVIGVIVIYLSNVCAEETNYLKVFESAKEQYQLGNYDSTISIIRAYLKKHGRDKPTEFIVPLLMEALVRENDIPYFNKLLSIYRRKFPKSKYMPRLIYLDGVVKAKEKKFKKAIISFANALDFGINKELDSLSLLNVESICKNEASTNDLSKLARDSKLNPVVGEIVSYYQIMNLYIADEIEESKKLAQIFRKKYSKSKYNTNLKKLISKSKRTQKATNAIGLLAPMSGDNADIGRYVVQGVQLAIEEYNSSNSQQIELITLDTRGNMVETAKKTQELIDIYKTPVIIGPILSTNATVAASILMKNEDIVMITPTATDDGIARLGNNIFQLNVTLSILGKRIARYAIENLNIKDFAILSPISDYGRVLTESFKNEILNLNGVIHAEEFFDEGTNDFRFQFESLRLKLAERKWGEIDLNGGPEHGNNTKNQRKIESYLADSTIEIGGLFIPSESEDVTKLSSQVYFHRLQTQLLGSNGWHTSTTIKEGKKYVNNAIFSTNFETNVQNDNWTSFFNTFKDRFKDEPDRIAAPLSYDAANLILNAIKQDEDMENISDLLCKVRNYKGASGIITFDPTEGVNSEAAIMKISNKKFIRVQ